MIRSHIHLRRATALNATVSIRHTFSAAAVRRALRLQDIADQNPSDPSIQAAFLKELGALNPMSVVRRVESGKYAQNDLVKKEYLKALAMTDRLTPAALASIFQASPLASTIPAASSTTAANADPLAQPTLGSQTPEVVEPISTTSSTIDETQHQKVSRISLTSGLSSAHPLKLQMPKPTFWEEVWGTVRVLLGTFVVVSGLVFVADALQPSQRFGVSDAEYTPVTLPSRSFSDVRGCDEAVEELREVVAYLKDPSVYTRLGGKLPKGLLLTGPPGTGKTLLARAVSGEAGVPFFYASGSEFDEVFVGVGARRMRALFQTAKQHAPCIVFIDEIDAVGGKRNPRDTHSSKMTLNQMLVEMDGFEGSDGVIVIGATNFPELLDTALTRPGRFDRQLPVQAPDVKGREQILSLYLNNIKVNKPDLSEMTKVIARGTPGFTGAELENLVNMASIHATANNGAVVTLQDMEFAREKILMGPERKSYRLTPESRVCTAHHEAGHALVAAISKDTDPVYKATILPRGMALGMVQQLPEDDQYSVSTAMMKARLDVMMAGRVAEEMLLGANDYTSGASSDLEQATNLARKMVTHWGLSSRVGPIYLGEEGMPVSPALQRIVDEEVEKQLKAAYERAKQMISANRAAHLALASALLERETLTGSEINELINKASSHPETLPAAVTPTHAPSKHTTPAIPTSKAPSIARATS